MENTDRAMVICLGVPDDRAEAVAADAANPADETTPTHVVLRPLEADLQALDDEWHDAEWAVVVVVARSVALLRLAMPLLDSLGTARRAIVDIEEGAPPGTLRSVPAPGFDRWTSDISAGHARLEVVRPRASRVREIVAATMVLRSARGACGLRPAVADFDALAWCVEEPTTGTTANMQRVWQESGDRERGLAQDVVLTTRPLPPPAEGRAFDVSTLCPPVDPAVVSDDGFRTSGAATGARLVIDGTGGWRIRDEAADLLHVRAGEPLTTAGLAALRHLSHVDATAPDDADPRVTARALTQLAAACVPLVTGPLPPPIAAMLQPDMVDALEAVAASDLTDEVCREAAGVRQRRAAMRCHSPQSGWVRIRESLGLEPAPQSQVSVLLATKRREFIRHALASVGVQRNVQVEVVLVTHGFELTGPETDRLRADLAAPLTVLAAPAETPLGSMLNSAVRVASGDLVTKMDDDDWYGPHHLEDVTGTLAWSGATLSSVRLEYGYLGDLDITIRHNLPDVRTTVAHTFTGGTLTMRRDDLLSLGGWRPVTGFEDLSLVRAVQQSGGRMHQTHGLGFVLCRHGRGHTWNPGTTPFLRGAKAQWRGFHLPPELGDRDIALAHYHDLRRRAAAAG